MEGVNSAAVTTVNTMLCFGSTVRKFFFTMAGLCHTGYIGLVTKECKKGITYACTFDGYVILDLYIYNIPSIKQKYNTIV